MRVRGLKCKGAAVCQGDSVSYPVRVRGLKFRCTPLGHSARVVPRAGTWIEIVNLMVSKSAIAVVPRAGTWIEIKIMPETPVIFGSYPVRVRGLKFALGGIILGAVVLYPVRVRGLKSATGERLFPGPGSYPVRVRGLKLVPGSRTSYRLRSYPVRVRGLKSGNNDTTEIDRVSYPVRVRGLKSFYHLSFQGDSGRTPCGYVD